MCTDKYSIILQKMWSRLKDLGSQLRNLAVSQVNDGGYHSGEEIKLTEYNPPEEGSEVRQAVPLSAFSSHVERMHSNENCGLGEEYRVSVVSRMYV